jgi:hypothetical protein
MSWVMSWCIGVKLQSVDKNKSTQTKSLKA